MSAGSHASEPRLPWSARTQLTAIGPVTCACGHGRAAHNLRRGVCWGVSCGCASWRPVVVSHRDDPGPTPPAWDEQEWCDGGYTCWHEECVAALVADRADAELEARATGADCERCGP